MTVVRPWPLRRARSVARRKPLSSPVCLLNEARKPSTTRSDGPLGRGTNRSGPKRCSGKVLGLIRLPSVPFLGALSVGIARKRPRRLRITAPLVERADDLGRLGVDQARGIQALVRIVPVAPAVGEPLAEPGARDLTPEFGLEPAAGVARPGGHGALDVAQLRLHVCLERTGDSGSELHRGRWQSDLDVVLDRSMMTSFDLRSALRPHRSRIGAINVVTSPRPGDPGWLRHCRQC